MSDEFVLEYTLDGALAAREIIYSGFVQAKIGLELGGREGNSCRWHYWKERVIHFMKELNKIDKKIIELERLSDNRS